MRAREALSPLRYSQLALNLPRATIQCSAISRSSAGGGCFAMATQSVIVLCGIALLLGGAIHALASFFHLNNGDPSSVKSRLWTPLQVAFAVSFLLIGIGVLGLQLRQGNQAGWPGTKGRDPGDLQTAAHLHLHTRAGLYSDWPDDDPGRRIARDCGLAGGPWDHCEPAGQHGGAARRPAERRWRACRCRTCLAGVGAPCRLVGGLILRRRPFTSAS